MRRSKLLWGILGLLAAALIAFLIFVPGMLERGSNKVVATNQKISDHARALHKRLMIIDLHGDTLMWKRDMRDRSTQGHIDLPRLAKGNVAMQVFSSVTKSPRGQNYDANSAGTDNITPLVMAQLQPPRTWTSLLQRSLYHAEKLKHVDLKKSEVDILRTKDDVRGLLSRRQVKGNGIGAMLSVEGLQNLEGKLENLDILFEAGFRMAGFAHFFDNEVAGSMHGLKKGGLTSLGRQVFARMEAKGMIIDIAHASHAAVAEMLALATKPVVSSHGGVQATCKVNRNLTDAEIRGVAKTGGVVGIGYWDAAICSTNPRDIARAMRHVRDLVGIDFVALGSDFDGATTTPFDAAGLVHVTQALIDEGFNDSDIAKVMGGNALRVFLAVLPAA